MQHRDAQRVTPARSSYNHGVRLPDRSRRSGGWRCRCGGSHRAPSAVAEMPSQRTTNHWTRAASISGARLLARRRTLGQSFEFFCRRLRNRQRLRLHFEQVGCEDSALLALGSASRKNRVGGGEKVSQLRTRQRDQYTTNDNTTIDAWHMTSASYWTRRGPHTCCAVGSVYRKASAFDRCVRN
jgi:hypothetical protein